MQLSDWVGPVLLIGLGDVLLGVAGSVLDPPVAMALLMTALIALATLCVRLAGRWPSKVGQPTSTTRVGFVTRRSGLP